MKKIKDTQIIDASAETKSPETPQNVSIEHYKPSPLHGSHPIAEEKTEMSDIVAMEENRPVGASHLEIRHTISESGIRPVGASDIMFHHTISESGNRPIADSELEITGTLSKNRPIASNNLDNPQTLMGYLD